MPKRLLLVAILLNLLTACAGGVELSSPMPVAPMVTSAPIAAATPTIASLPTIPAPAQPLPPPTAMPPGEPVQISPADPRLRYTGRFDFQDLQAPAFDWSGSTIEVAFMGPALTILLDDGANLYDVTLDGETSVLQTAPGASNYEVATDLGPGTHTLRVTKRTEAYVGAAVFRGLILDRGGQLVDLPPRPERSLVFIGDSITAGYGIEGDSPECYFTPATQNATLTYAAQTAVALDAEYTLLALSGLGVARNLGEAEGTGGPTAVAYVNRTLGMNGLIPQPANEPGPDGVVINLGTNDFSSQPFPDAEVFVNAYRELLTAVRARYPEAEIVATAGPLMMGQAPTLIRQAVELQQSAGDRRLHFVFLEDTLARSGEDFGCDWHPNVSGHRKMAAELRPALQEILGW